ncbi:hypothetical protein [Methylobacterium sp. WL7]|uniref:hypothetical protein n=1 Tax=Methylobacterium sp. WL7 TaxID=2603900 RepID=UPI0011C9D20F|nr:hypothetical protein [Methylobacterium sp. WL7]TXN43596.1 hypothetical protein FV233_18025 [Methylobacterium sp. WL7]
MAFLYSLDDDAGGAFTVDPSTGTLTVASPSFVGVGQAFRITWRAVDTSGAQPPFTRTELIGVTAGAPKLGALSLLNLGATATIIFASAINGQTAGSTVTAVSSDGTALTVSGGVVSGTFSGAGTPTITLTETLTGAIGSPFTSTASVAVAAAPLGPSAPPGFILLAGSDGQQLLGADAQELYGVAA